MADINALYASLLAADEASDAAALAAVAWQMYGQLATTAADLGALRARFRVYAAAPHASGRRAASRGAHTPTPAAAARPSGTPPPERAVHVRTSTAPRLVPACLAGALKRQELWGVWGGELFLRGAIVPRKRPRGRPRKTDVAA